MAHGAFRIFVPSSTRIGLAGAARVGLKTHFPTVTPRSLGHGSQPHTPSEHPNPHQNGLKWAVHLSQNGTIGVDPQPLLSRMMSARTNIWLCPSRPDTEMLFLVPTKATRKRESRGSQQDSTIRAQNIFGLFCLFLGMGMWDMVDQVLYMG